MSITTTPRRVGAALVAAAVLGAGVVLSGVALGGAHAGDGPFPDGIVVVGDSITARYDDSPGSETQGWWSIVGRHFDAEVTTYAQSGSGYQRPGLRCTGNRFVDRDHAFDDPPSVFIVQGGRNDWASCHDGRHVVSTDAAVRDGVVEYLRTARERLPASTRIVVLGPPWGPLDPWQQRRVTSIVHTAAEREGLEYVSTTGSLEPGGRTSDGVHPTRSGSRALGAVVVDALSRPSP